MRTCHPLLFPPSLLTEMLHISLGAGLPLIQPPPRPLHMMLSGCLLLEHDVLTPPGSCICSSCARHALSFPGCTPGVLQGPALMPPLAGTSPHSPSSPVHRENQSLLYAPLQARLPLEIGFSQFPACNTLLATPSDFNPSSSLAFWLLGALPFVSLTNPPSQEAFTTSSCNCTFGHLLI